MSQVSLIAMPDPVFGEKACACVVLKPGTALAFDELIAHLRGQHIAAFKLPEPRPPVDARPSSFVEKPNAGFATR